MQTTTTNRTIQIDAKQTKTNLKKETHVKNTTKLPQREGKRLNLNIKCLKRGAK